MFLRSVIDVLTAFSSPKTFEDPHLEHQFQKHYATLRAQRDALVAAAAILLQIVLSLKSYIVAACCSLLVGYSAGLCRSTAGAALLSHSTIHLFRTALTILPFFSHVFYGGPYVVASRAAVTVIARILFVLTMVPSSWLRNAALWRHRVLFIHSPLAVLMTPTDLYWLGGILSWLAAVVMDTMVQPEECEQSVGCVFRTLKDMAAAWLAAASANPSHEASRIVAALFSQDSSTHLGCLIPPWLFMLYMEHRARKTWLAAQQRLATASANGSSSLNASNPLVLQSEPLPDATAVSSKAGNGCHSAGESSAQVACMATGRCSATDAQATHAMLVKSAVTTPAAVPATTASSSSRFQPSTLKYHSPLTTRTLSFKFNHPPNAKPEDFQKVKERLIAAVQEHVSTSAPVSSNPGAAASLNSNHTTSQAAAAQDNSAVITQCVAFKGCWQLVLDVTVGAVGGVWQEQQVDSIVQTVLGEMPDWHFSAWQQLEPEPPTPAPTTKDIRSLAAAAAKHIFINPVAVCYSSPSSDNEAGPHAAMVTVLVVNSILAQELLSAGHRHLRVVVAKGAGQILSDRQYELSQPVETASAEDVKFVLRFDGSSGTSAQQSITCEAYSVVVLLPDQEAEPAPTADAATLDSRGLRSRLLIRLPLLLLPAGAQQELQDVFNKSVEDGKPHVEAYQHLLQVLCDWVMLLQPMPNTKATVNSNSSMACSAPDVLQQLKMAVCDALLSSFDEADMLHCYKLIRKQRQLLVDLHSQQQDRPTVEALGGSSASAAAAADSTKVNAATPHPAVGSDREPGPSSKRSSAAADVPATADARVSPDVTCWSVVFGFPDSVDRRAYNRYKAVALMRHALVYCCLYMTIVAGTYVKAAALWRSVSIKTASLSPVVLYSVSVEALSLVIKASFVASLVLTKLLLWLAARSTQQHQLGRWQQFVASFVHWRDAAFVLTMATHAVIARALMLYGGIWGAASTVAMQSYFASMVSFGMYILVLQPTILRVSPIAIMMILVVQLWWPGAVYPREEFFWGHNVLPGGLLTLVGGCNAAYWEYSMQKSYVAHCRAYGRAARLQ